MIQWVVPCSTEEQRKESKQMARKYIVEVSEDDSINIGPLDQPYKYGFDTFNTFVDKLEDVLFPPVTITFTHEQYEFLCKVTGHTPASRLFLERDKPNDNNVGQNTWFDIYQAVKDAR